jgi:hypothetical protein
MRYNGQWLIDYAANSFGNWDQIWDWLPRAPNKVGITTITDDAMTITWQDNSSTESGFIVEMKTDYNIVERIYNWIIGASSQWIPHRVGSDLTELTITGLYPDHKSCFRVYAETAYGNSETSTVVCGKTQSSVTKPTPQPYPRGVKTYYLFNCHYQFRTVHAWVRDLTTAGNWVDHRELPAAPSGACRQNGTAYATFNPISGHRYHVVAIDGSLGNCPEDNPDRINGSCRRFETVFDGDTSGYTRYDAIDSNTITSPLTGYEPPPPPVNNPPPRQPGGGDGRPPRQEQ